jgi:glycosyltransferase involved in cell wall biosynthesis
MSKSEGLHNPSLEAGACGIPVITTKCGASEEIIVDGVNGFLIDRNDESLQKALLSIKNDKFIKVSMGENIFNTIKNNWAWDIKIQDFRNMFQFYFSKIKRSN